jgi:hypothetical protein
MLRSVITTACLCISGASLAQGTKLSGSELKDLVAGATVEIDAPLGYKIPLRYAVDGQVTGEAGSLASYLGSATDTGKWWVNGEKLCHKWKQWFSGELKCLRLARDGRTIHWASQDGETGTASIVALAPRIEVAAAAALPPPTVPLPLVPSTAARPAPEARVQAPLPPPEPKPVRSGMISPAPGVPASVAPIAPSILLAAVPPPAAEPPVSPAARPAAPMAAAQPPPAAEPAAYRVANIRNDDVLNVRSGPSTDHAVVAALQPGSRGVVITGDCQSDWCPVQHEAASGWVNRSFLSSEAGYVSAFPAQRATASVEDRSLTAARARVGRDSPAAPRACLSAAAKKLLASVEEKFGPVRTVSTCRAGATIGDSGRPSRHASGNAIDFDAGARKGQILNWLIANHRAGGVMTYPDMDHIHIDVGPHFVSIAGGTNYASWRGNGRRSADSDDD